MKIWDKRKIKKKEKKKNILRNMGQSPILKPIHKKKWNNSHFWPRFCGSWLLQKKGMLFSSFFPLHFTYFKYSPFFSFHSYFIFSFSIILFFLFVYWSITRFSWRDKEFWVDRSRLVNYQTKIHILWQKVYILFLGCTYFCEGKSLYYL